MGTSSTALPQLSSYLPSLSLSMCTTSNMDSSMDNSVKVTKRRNSIQSAFLVLDPMQYPVHQLQNKKLKRKQQPPLEDTRDVVDVSVNITSLSRPNRMYQVHEQVDPLVSSKDRPASTRAPFAQDDDKQDVKTPRYSEQSPLHRERTSRYLSEGNRREIIMRISDGEKQVTLAREFKISRAAICNLYKKRWEVLARESRNPESKHPKKPRGQRLRSQMASTHKSKDEAIPVVRDMSTILICTDEELHDTFETSASNPSTVATKGRNEQPTMIRDHCAYRHLLHPHHHHLVASDQWSSLHKTVTSASKSLPFRVHEASAYSYPCRSLIATLRDETISTVIFQQQFTRLVRLLIEEALTCLPFEDVEIKNSFGDICHIAKAMDEQNICGISMENKGMVLLRMFSTTCPLSSIGVLSVAAKAAADDNSIGKMWSSVIHAQLPPVRPRQVVLLLDNQCTTGNEACAVLHYLVHERQISARRIYFVSVISSLEGLQNVLRHFPDVTLISAQVDTVLDINQQIRPGIGDVMQRFWNIHIDRSTEHKHSWLY